MGTANRFASCLRAFRLPRVRGWLLLGGMVILLAPLASGYYFTCAVCGMDRAEIHALGMLVHRTDAETDCSIWYSVNVEAHHDHVWVRCTWSNAYSLSGIRWIGLGNNSLGRADGPLVHFGSNTRLLMYQECPDPNLMRDAFLRLARWDSPSTKDRKEQREIEYRLAEFEKNGRFAVWPIYQP